MASSYRGGSTAAMAAAAGGALIMTAVAVFRKSSRTSTAMTNIIDNSDMITPTLVVSVFDGLFVHMQGVLSQLGQQIQQIQMSGQTIPEKQLRQLLKAEFERALLAQQNKIYEAHDVDEEQLESATWEFLRDNEVNVRKAVERFQKLYENVTGETALA